MYVVSFRRVPLSEHASLDELKSPGIQQFRFSKSGPFERPISAIALHRPHKLSSIREYSGSSRTSAVDTKSESRLDCPGHQSLPGPGEEEALHTDQKIVVPESNEPGVPLFMPPSLPAKGIRDPAPPSLSLPVEEIPKRKSSISALSSNFLESHRAGLQNQQRRSRNRESTNLTKQGASSPVKNAVEKAAQSSETLQSSSPRTFVRTTPPSYLLDDDNPSNPRLAMTVRLPSHIFVSGGSVDGQIELKIDATSSKKMRSEPLFISRLSVDVMGVEEVEDGRRHIFLSLATELFDGAHPPPCVLVGSQKPEKPERGSELYWRTRPASASIPFSVDLPLKVGPPPYSTRRASIRYILCPSAVIKIGEKRSAVRQTWAIQLLPVHHPERALGSLPSPLLATDILTLSHESVHSCVKLTAGLHRQTWISGGVIFIDVHIVNSTEKSLQRIDLYLEKSVLWFSHPIPGTSEKSASHLRLPSKIDTQVVHKSSLKRSKQWHGIASQAAELRTCELDIPKSHVTIGNGRFFEVRYFVKVTVVALRNKSVSVQLPVTLIHINSLDVLPNSAAQVANSIEAKRSLAAVAQTSGYVRYPPCPQGQEFLHMPRPPHPRPQSRATPMDPRDLRLLTQALDDSPRRTGKTTDADIRHATDAGDVTTDESDGNFRPKRLSCHQHPTSRPDCYHCHLLLAEHAARLHSETGPRLPRLQVSTSGLGFTESEFEMPPDSPLRKVMLSEKERHMINQQREIRLQRQWSQHKNKRVCSDEQKRVIIPTHAGWKNIAMPPRSVPGRVDTPRYENHHHRRSTQHAIPRVNSRPNAVSPTITSKNGNKTNPGRKRASFNDSVSATNVVNRTSRGMRSMDWNGRVPWHD